MASDMLCSMTMRDLDQLASAVYATGCYLNNQRHDDEVEIAGRLRSQVPDLQPDDAVVQMPQNQSSGDDIVTNYNPQTTVLPYFCSNSHEMFRKSLFSISSRGVDYAALTGTHLQLPSTGQNYPETIFSSQQEESFSRILEAACFTSSSSSSAPSGPSLLSKKRMRWTQELHEKFINCVNNLGGAEKATPKAILRMMESKELTIFHIKSHLQKYRAEKHMSEHKQGNIERSSIDIPELYMKNSMQIKEALQLQLDFEKQLYEQLKIQQQLQLKIEENGKQLKIMMQQQRKINNL